MFPLFVGVRPISETLCSHPQSSHVPWGVCADSFIRVVWCIVDISRDLQARIVPCISSFSSSAESTSGCEGKVKLFLRERPLPSVTLYLLISRPPRLCPLLRLRPGFFPGCGTNCITATDKSQYREAEASYHSPACCPLHPLLLLPETVSSQSQSITKRFVPTTETFPLSGRKKTSIYLFPFLRLPARVSSFLSPCPLLLLLPLPAPAPGPRREAEARRKRTQTPQVGSMR